MNQVKKSWAYNVAETLFGPNVAEKKMGLGWAAEVAAVFLPTRKIKGVVQLAEKAVGLGKAAKVTKAAKAAKVTKAKQVTKVDDYDEKIKHGYYDYDSVWHPFDQPPYTKVPGMTASRLRKDKRWGRSSDEGLSYEEMKARLEWEERLSRGFQPHPSLQAPKAASPPLTQRQELRLDLVPKKKRKKP